MSRSKKSSDKHGPEDTIQITLFAPRGIIPRPLVVPGKLSQTWASLLGEALGPILKEIVQPIMLCSTAYSPRINRGWMTTNFEEPIGNYIAQFQRKKKNYPIRIQYQSNCVATRGLCNEKKQIPVPAPDNDSEPILLGFERVELIKEEVTASPPICQITSVRRLRAPSPLPGPSWRLEPLPTLDPVPGPSRLSGGTGRVVDMPRRSLGSQDGDMFYMPLNTGSDDDDTDVVTQTSTLVDTKPWFNLPDLDIEPVSDNEGERELDTPQNMQVEVVVSDDFGNGQDDEDAISIRTADDEEEDELLRQGIRPWPLKEVADKRLDELGNSLYLRCQKELQTVMPKDAWRRNRKNAPFCTLVLEQLFQNLY